VENKDNLLNGLSEDEKNKVKTLTEQASTSKETFAKVSKEIDAFLVEKIDMSDLKVPSEKITFNLGNDGFYNTELEDNPKYAKARSQPTSRPDRKYVIRVGTSIQEVRTRSLFSS
jgi:hypothetical protein